MRTKLLAVVVLVFSSLTGFSQVSAGLEMGLPMGNFSNLAGTGFGATVRYDASINKQLSWSASIGYLSFSGKTLNIGNVSIPFGSTSNVPLAGGVKYYFPGTEGLYGAMDITINFLSTYGYTFNSGNGGGYNTIGVSNTVIGVNPGLGYRVSTWDFAFRYNSAGDFSSLGLRAAYVFGKK